MSKKMRLLTAILIAVLFCGVTVAQAPEVNINARLHPNLAEAQRLVVQANRYIDKAQKANRGDMKGHAEKARQLLAQANQELKAAAEAANTANAAQKRGKR